MIFGTHFKINTSSIISNSIKWMVILCVQSISIITISFSPLYCSAEGTKQLMPTSTDFGFIQINDRGRKFATYNAPNLNRLYIHVCNPGEIIYVGFKQSDNDVSFRIKDPSGNIVVAAQTLSTSGQGFISTYNQAVAGPQQLVGASGYNAISYTSLLSGDYYIEFNNSGNAQRIFDFFDITVANANTAQSGRIWSYSWDINTKATTNPFTAKMYIFSKDSIVTSIDFNGMQPFGAVITANSTGLSNTGNVIADRASQVGDFTLPEYKIFLNDPDPTCYPTGSFGTITAPTKVTGCDPANRCINITVNKPGQIEMVLDLNGTLGYQPNSTDLLIITPVVAGINCIPWNSKDGEGNVIISITNIPLQVNYLNGVTHLPLYDVEANPDGYIVELIRPAGTQPSLYWDDTNITAGTAIDAKVNLTGCSNMSGCHKWKNRGNNAASETINTWWYPNIVTDNLTFDLIDVQMDADIRNPIGQLNDSLVCETIPFFQLQGEIANNVQGSWTGGLGSFSPSRNVFNPVYTPTAAERKTGFVKLFLNASIVQGACTDAIDSIRINFEMAPIIDVGLDKIICSKNNPINISAFLTHASTGIWSGGSGLFGEVTNSNTNYTPASSDISNEFVQLIFTSTGSRVCAQEDDTLTISFNKPVEIEVGDPIQICEDIKTVSIQAMGDQTAQLLWTGGTGSFSSTNSLTTEYTLGNNENLRSEIILKLTASKGVCPDSTDMLKINIHALPDIHAGSDTLICKGGNLTITGTSNANTTSWYLLPSHTITSNSKTNSLQNVSTNSTYVFEGINTYQCKNSDTILVDVYDLPSLNPGGPYCLQKELILVANATNVPNVPSLYIWKKENTLLQSDPIVSNLAITDAGKYTLTYKTDGCSKDVQVIVNPKPVLVSPDTLSACEGNSIELFTNSSIPSTIKWFDSNKSFIQSGSSIFVIASPIAQLYYIEAEAATGCSNNDSIVTVSTIVPNFSIENAEICKDSFATLDIMTNNIPTHALSELNYAWKYNSKIISTNKILQSNVPGTYTGTVTLKGCAASKDGNIIVHDLPTSELPLRYTFCSDNGNSIYLNAGTGYMYHWIQSNETTQSISISKAGTYDVLIYNTFMCKIKAQTNVIEECKPTLFVSNAFSPNGDQINDIFQTFDNHIGSYSMTIFSRWGEIIFQSTDKSVFWDGYYNGKQMDVGVYPFILKYEGDTDSYKGPYIIEGSITLIK